MFMVGSCDFCRQYKYIILFSLKFNLLTNRYDQLKKKLTKSNIQPKKQTQTEFQSHSINAKYKIYIKM